MTFNVFEMGTIEAVDNAFRVLSDGGVVLEPIHELPWSKYCATIIDKFEYVGGFQFKRNMKL